MKSPALPLGGIVACSERLDNGNLLYAEIEPSGGRWYRQFLPNVKRWWYEISEIEVTPTDELKIGVLTHAYSKYGSGGSYTLRGCMIKARRAIEQISCSEPDFDNLTDDTFLDRATAKDFELPKYSAIYQKDGK